MNVAPVLLFELAHNSPRWERARESFTQSASRRIGSGAIRVDGCETSLPACSAIVRVHALDHAHENSLRC